MLRAKKLFYFFLNSHANDSSEKMNGETKIF